MSTTARRYTAKKPVACLSTLVAVFLLRSCEAFVVPQAGAGTRGTPANKAKASHGSAFSEAGLGLTMAADGTGLPGRRALPPTGRSFVPEETTSGKEEEKDTMRAAMASALAEMGAHEGRRGGGREGSEGGGWRKGFRKVRGAVTRIWKRGDSPAAAGGVQVGADSYSSEYEFWV